eukprot:1199116-Pyramimonas_sp.AAC.1
MTTQGGGTPYAMCCACLPPLVHAIADNTYGGRANTTREDNGRYRAVGCESQGGTFEEQIIKGTG